MKSVLVFVSVAVAVCAGISFAPEELDEHWTDFKNAFGKSYSGRDEEVRRQIFQDRLSKITNHNLKHDLGHNSFRRKLNKFSDMTHEEFIQTMNRYKKVRKRNSQSASHFNFPSDAKMPESVDWRKEDMVNPVQDQGECGSCWTFGATGSLEGQHKKKTGKLVILSKQQLLDCVYPNAGCNGGLESEAYEYIMKNNGSQTDESYPYTGICGPCRYDPTKVAATVEGYVEIQENEESLKRAVATVGPVSAGIDAKTYSFQDYASGIFYDPECNPDDLNHAVLVVGYGTEDGKDYWIVKNSYGTTWGMEGYMHMAMNRNNHCGIANDALFPLV